MQNGLRLAAMALVTLALLAGCAKSPPASSDPQETEQTGTGSAEQPPAPQAMGGDALFPLADWHIVYSIRDEGAPAAYKVDEVLVRDPGRMVAVQNGTPYATWHLREDGVWRRDPKGGGFFLRYLPPALVDGEAWQQQSGDATVWFRLRISPHPCVGGAATTPPPDQCWELTVINRGELSTFRFAAGLGPVHVLVENTVNKADSFVKESMEDRPSTLAAADKGAALGAAVAWSDERAAVVVPVTEAVFEQQEAELTKAKS